MKKKNGIRIGAVILILFIIAQIGAGASRLSLNSSGDGLKDDGTNETSTVDLEGSIKVNLFTKDVNKTMFGSLVYPTIEMSDAQTLDINTTQDNESWIVNTTLRVYIDKSDAVSNKSYLLPRTLTVFGLVVRKNKPLISGALRDLVLGKSFIRINVLKENTSDYLEIPLKYTTKAQDEEQRLYIFALGSLMGVIAQSPPIFQMKTVDLTCHYTNTVESDKIPPVTTIELSGDLINETTMVYNGMVAVSFKADDFNTVNYTKYMYSYSPNEYMTLVSPWLNYSAGEIDLYKDHGEYEFNYYSVDIAGNIESTKTKAFIIEA